LPIYSIEEDVEKKLILSVGARDSEYIHSRFRNIPYLRRRRPEPFAEISPETAREYGFKDGDNIIVKTGVGKIEIKVKLNDGVFPGTVFIPHGWAETNANILTDNRNLDPISGFPSLKSVPCTLEKKAVVSNS
jgi:anaerobic selenocysteine-containing dehydrogenase